jgi:hypothetical protein
MDSVQSVSVAEHAEKHVTITVTVNNRPVRFHQREATGAQIKDTAIAQGVAIEADFALFEDKGHGHLKQISDCEEVTLHEHEKFKAVAPDDNS